MNPAFKKSIVQFFSVFLLLFNFGTITASISENECLKIQTGNFFYDTPFGNVILVRSKSESIEYRIYPSNFLRYSIKWLSPCVVEQKLIEIHDDIFPKEKMPEQIGEKSILYITGVSSEGYSWKLFGKDKEEYTGNTKKYKKPLNKN